MKRKVQALHKFIRYCLKPPRNSTWSAVYLKATAEPCSGVACIVCVGERDIVVSLIFTGSRQANIANPLRSPD